MDQPGPTLEGLVSAQQYQIQSLEEKLRPLEDIYAHLKDRCYVCHCCHKFGFINECHGCFRCETCLKTYRKCHRCISSTTCGLTSAQLEQVQQYWRDIVDFTPFVCPHCKNCFYHGSFVADICHKCSGIHETCSDCWTSHPFCKDCTS